jgi:putative tricarboxylic transport membrane protein
VGGLAATRIFGQVLRLPRVVLAPIIMLFVTIGVYSVNNAVFDLWVLLGVGLIAYALERLDYPNAPIVLGLLLGPMAESQLRLAMTISQGNPVALVSTPIAIVLALLSAAILLTPAWRAWRSRDAAEAGDAAA